MSSSSPSNTTFVHPALDTETTSIRLLTINPLPTVKKTKNSRPPKETPSQVLACTLTIHSLKPKPKYECLSYTWGSESAIHPIQINDQPFLVRTNLLNALNHLRSSKPRTIWIDAICINQLSIPERNAQVSIMAQIYKRATQVVVWLGIPPTPYSEYDNNVTIIENEENRKAIVENAYWDRLWIVQEIVLAKYVVFLHGTSEIDESDLEAKLDPDWETLQERIAPLLEHRRLGRETVPFEVLVLKFRGSLCFEVRDQVFGLLGMASVVRKCEVVVDYEVGLWELYGRLLDLHKMSKALDGSSVEPAADGPDGLDRPKRVMKFSSLLQKMLWSGSETVEESIAIDAANSISSSSKFYCARGAIAGGIIYLGPTYSETVSSEAHNETWKTAFNDSALKSTRGGRAFADFKEDEEEYSDLARGWNDDYVKKIQQIDSSTSFGYRWSVTSPSNLPSLQDLSLETKAQDAKYNKNVEIPTNNSNEPCRFIAENSRIGFAPPGTRIGDLVVHFWDSEVAVIVRPVENTKENDRWKIIGKADLSQRNLRKGWSQMISEDALNVEVGNFKTIRKALGDGDFRQMMHFKLDIETLQKISC